MKILPILLLNVATAAGAIVVYDQLRDEPAPRDAVVTGSVDTTDLERRLAALESDRRPQLETKLDASVLDRIEALESAEAPSSESGADSSSSGERPSEETVAPFASAADWQPTPEDVQRFRTLRKAVERDDRIMKNAERVERALKKLALGLDEKQRSGITEAFTDFQPRIRQIWDEVKTEAQATIAAGGTIDRREIVASTTVLIQQEFAEALTNVVSHADAEAVAAALMAGGK